MDNTSNTVVQADQETWFLAQVEKSELPVKDLLRFLDEVRKRGQIDQAKSWAEMLQDALIERKDRRDGLLVLHVRAHWGLKTPAVKETLLRMLEGVREDRIMLDHCGLERIPDAAESVRRLQVLFALKPEAMVYDKTWGAGIVRRLDLTSARVVIDFESKAQHQMSLAYAGEVLTLLRDDHLMAIKLRKPEELTFGCIVKLMEGGIELTNCMEKPGE